MSITNRMRTQHNTNSSPPTKSHSGFLFAVFHSSILPFCDVSSAARYSFVAVCFRLLSIVIRYQYFQLSCIHIAQHTNIHSLAHSHTWTHWLIRLIFAFQFSTGSASVFRLRRRHNDSDTQTLRDSAENDIYLRAATELHWTTITNLHLVF